MSFTELQQSNACYIELSHLFVKLPLPGDSEVTFSDFESSYYLLLFV